MLDNAGQRYFSHVPLSSDVTRFLQTCTNQLNLARYCSLRPAHRAPVYPALFFALHFCQRFACLNRVPLSSAVTSFLQIFAHWLENTSVFFEEQYISNILLIMRYSRHLEHVFGRATERILEMWMKCFQSKVLHCFSLLPTMMEKERVWFICYNYPAFTHCSISLVIDWSKRA